MMIKFIVGIDCVEDIEPLCKASCDEFYCGVKPKSWIEGKNKVESPNARSSPGTSLASFDELKKVCDKAHVFKKKVFFTLNAQVNNENSVSMLKFLDSAYNSGIDGVIISDVALIMDAHTRYPELEIHASSLFPALNSSSINFLKNIGVKRTILSRHLTIEDMKKLPKDMEYEAFLMNEGCKNVDAFCRFDHGFGEQQQETPACCISYDMQCTSCSFTNKKTTQRIKKKIGSSRTRCGICAIKELNNVGCSVFKIVSRGHSLKNKLAYLEFAKQTVDSMFDTDAVSKNQHKFETCFGYSCTFDDCYYPNIMGGDN